MLLLAMPEEDRGPVDEMYSTMEEPFFSDPSRVAWRRQVARRMRGNG